MESVHKFLRQSLAYLKKRIIQKVLFLCNYFFFCHGKIPNAVTQVNVVEMYCRGKEH